MIYYFKRFFWLTIIACLQIAVVPYLSHFPFQLDLILIYLFYVGFYVDGAEAGVLGVLGGLLRDLLAASYFGLSAMVYGLAGFLSGFVRRVLVHYPVVAFSLAVWSGTFLTKFFFHFFLYLFGVQVSLEYLLAVSLGSAFYNLLVAVLISLVIFIRQKELVFEEVR